MASVIVSSGQSVSNLSFTGGDDLTVSAGGVSRDDFVGVPGVETVYGSSFGDTVSGRQQTGTSASIAVFVAGSGAVVSNVTVLNGAFLAVSAGANVYGAVFSNASGGGSGALTNVSVGGGSVVTAAAVVGGTVGSGGMLSLNALNVPGTPTTTGVTVYSGGTFDIAFAVASGTVLSGGRAFTSASVPFAGHDGEALGTRILAGGVLSVQNFTNRIRHRHRLGRAGATGRIWTRVWRRDLRRDARTRIRQRWLPYLRRLHRAGIRADIVCWRCAERCSTMAPGSTTPRPRRAHSPASFPASIAPTVSSWPASQPTRTRRLPCRAIPRRCPPAAVATHWTSPARPPWVLPLGLARERATSTSGAASPATAPAPPSPRRTANARSRRWRLETW